MKRLTIRNSDGSVSQPTDLKWAEALEKLAAYEDTGLEPEEVRSVKWVPVTERLPEETGSYLVWMRWPHDESHVHSIINFDADCEAFGEWEEYYDPVSLGWAGSDFIKIENVYAWMPLPEPPDGGAE